jgi:hypothetical protein
MVHSYLTLGPWGSDFVLLDSHSLKESIRAVHLDCRLAFLMLLLLIILLEYSQQSYHGKMVFDILINLISF